MTTPAPGRTASCWLWIPFLLATAIALAPFDAGAEDEEGESDSALSDSLAFELLRQLAREDTAGIPSIDYIYGEYIDVEENRPTLREIIGWCIDHEQNRFASVEDVTYRRRVRTASLFDPDKEDGRKILTEHVAQVYVENPDRRVEVQLGSREWDSKDDEEEVDLDPAIESSSGSLGSLPLFFEALDDYDFEIVERRILADRVLYKISFEPRSEFASLPEGWFLVDTADYQILRAEYFWTENVPFPIFLKAVDRVVLQRQRLEDLWITERATIEVTLRDLPLIPMPRSITVNITLEDVQINQGIADSIWVEG